MFYEYHILHKLLKESQKGRLGIKNFYIKKKLEFWFILFTHNKKKSRLLEQKKKLRKFKLYMRYIFVVKKCNKFVKNHFYFTKKIMDCENLNFNV